VTLLTLKGHWIEGQSVGQQAMVV